MKRFAVYNLALSYMLSFANIGPQGFGAFKNHYFVETGTFLGKGIQLALDAGFKEVRSIEFLKNKYNAAVQKYKNNAQVKIWHGDSACDLWEIIEDIDEPITFWLDAHVYPPRKDGGKNCPLIEELDQIKRHPIKVHTILIDDMHCAGTLAFDGLTKEDLVQKLLEINPDYEIFYIAGGDRGEYPENVMVAKVCCKV